MITVDTTTDDLLAEIDDGVALLTFNRPQHRNAFTVHVLDALPGCSPSSRTTTTSAASC